MPMRWRWPPENSCGYSFAALAGKPNWQIRKQSGHQTEAMLNRYIRDGRLFADNALAGLL